MPKKKQTEKGEGEKWLDYLTEDMDKEPTIGTSFRSVGRTFVFLIWIWIKLIRGLYKMVFRRKKKENKPAEGEIVLPPPQERVPPLRPVQQRVVVAPEQPQPAQPVPQAQPQPPVPPSQLAPPLPPAPTTPVTDDLFKQFNDALNEITGDVNEAFKSVSEEIKQIRADIEKLYTLIGVKAGVQPTSQGRIVFSK